MQTESEWPLYIRHIPSSVRHIVKLLSVDPYATSEPSLE